MSGTNRSLESKTGGPRIVLVNPQMPENIGATARAMLNCGLTDLALVKPRQAWPHGKAVTMASGATEVLDNTELFDDLADAVGDLQRVYATSARPRDMILRTVTPAQAGAEMRQAAKAGEKIGIVFGPENAGLTNDHLAHVDTVISIPLNPAFSSLNLAQAVLIVAYEWSHGTSAGALAGVAHDDDAPPAATKAELDSFLNRLFAALDDAEYFSTPAMRPSMIRNLRTIFQRLTLAEPEVRALQGVLSALVKGRRGRE